MSDNKAELEISNYTPKFNQAISYVLANEGGYSNDPIDPGGSTNFGITQAAYSEYCNGLVNDMSLAQADDYYFNRFWKHYNLEDIKLQGPATASLDVLVNLGPSFGAELIQSAVCPSSVDGKFGPETVAHINAMDGNDFLRYINTLLLRHYESICTKNTDQLKFLHGWTNRANRILTLVG